MQGVFTSDVNGVPAVEVKSTNGAIGIRTNCDTGLGVFGFSQSNIAVLGNSVSSVGVVGSSLSNYGVAGSGGNAGVMASNPFNQNAAYLASGCCAAWFTGGVTVTGPLTKGGGGFCIDHPLDPAQKFLAHSFVESPDMKNIYDGVVTADANGEATVILPDYFDAVNQEFRYQLTPIGGAAPELHVAREIGGNQFTIAGAKPRMRVSWQVTGIRHDAWAEGNRIEVEPTKPDKEHGFYLHPELHGHGPEQSIARLRHPHPAQLDPVKPSP